MVTPEIVTDVGCTVIRLFPEVTWTETLTRCRPVSSVDISQSLMELLAG